jgi:hypothetical protein
VLFQVMSIEFDFTGCLETQGSYELPEEQQQEVIDSVLGEVFEVDAEEELTNAITRQTGWSIQNIHYRRVYS